jgi:integrase
MIKYSIKIGLHVKPNNAGQEVAEEVGIRLRVSWCGLRCDLRSGYVVAPGKWDEANSCVKLGAKNSYRQTAGEINRGLVRLASVIDEIFSRWPLEHCGAHPSVAEFKNAFDVAEGRVKPAEAEAKEPGFSQVWARFVSEMGASNNWSRATYVKFNSIKNHLLKWRPELSLSEFDKNDFAGWVAYLQNNAKLLNTTVAKDVGFLRWFLRWAAANGLYSGMAHETYRPRFKGLDCKEVIFLSWEELLAFLAYDFGRDASGVALSQVRDVFCFCCFTGLRYSDVFKLRRSDLRLEATPPYMSVVTKKTTARLHIELNKYALGILEKYAGVGFPDDKALPVISNQRMNDHLHTAAEVAGLYEPIRVVSYVGNLRQEVVVPKYEVITTHAGRRTFVVNALRLGIPAAVVMEWTGHSDYKAMKPYIKIVDDVKAENMERFNNFEDPKNRVPEKVPEKHKNNK